MIQFDVPGEPKGKSRPRFAHAGKRVVTYTPANTRAYEKEILCAAKKAMNGNLRQYPVSGAVCVRIRAFFGIRPSWTNKKKLAALNGEIRPLVKPDVDNVLKVVLDALNKTVWHDDVQVVSASIEKCYSNKSWVEVTVWD